MADDAAPLQFGLHEIERVPVTAAGTRRFTREDMFAMMRAGVIEEGERTELIEGEFIPMAHEGEAHFDTTHILDERLRMALRGLFDVHVRGVLNMEEDSQLSPDIAVWPLGTRFRDMFPINLKLAVEISDTTRRKDMGRKATVYAKGGVPEYWVFDVGKGELWVHRGAYDGGWRERFLLVEPQIAPLCAPTSAIHVGDLISAR